MKAAAEEDISAAEIAAAVDSAAAAAEGNTGFGPPGSRSCACRCRCQKGFGPREWGRGREGKKSEFCFCFFPCFLLISHPPPPSFSLKVEALIEKGSAHSHILLLLVVVIIGVVRAKRRHLLHLCLPSKRVRWRSASEHRRRLCHVALLPRQQRRQELDDGAVEVGRCGDLK